jgi:hypothetical protein
MLQKHVSPVLLALHSRQVKDRARIEKGGCCRGLCQTYVANSRQLGIGALHKCLSNGFTLLLGAVTRSNSSSDAGRPEVAKGGDITGND